MIPSWNAEKTEMNHFTDPRISAREIAEELKDVAQWMSGGGLSPERFRISVAMLEKQKLLRHGLTLSSEISEGPIVHFSLRFADTGELCASMDVDPATGAVEMQIACAE